MMTPKMRDSTHVHSCISAVSVRLAPLIVGVAACPGESHLQVLSSHVGSDKFIGMKVFFKQFKYFLTALCCGLPILEFPKVTNFAFVGFADQHARSLLPTL